MKSETLDIYANGWGISREKMIEIPQMEWDQLKSFREKVPNTAVTHLSDREVRFADTNGSWLRAEVVTRGTAIGGNAWNTACATVRVLETVDPSLGKGLRFHTFGSVDLPALPFPAVLRDVGACTRMRVSYVIKGPNGDDPLYWSDPPAPVETGSFPDTPNVLISSGGPDVFEEILAHRRRNPNGKIFLAPGSAQVRRGIPSEVLEELHFLSCNRWEAEGLAQHLDPKPEDEVRTIVDLLDFFRDTGIPEVRITDGTRGVHAICENEEFHEPAFDRKDERVQVLAEQLKGHGIANERTFRYPNANGCGDTSLGTHLALQMADYPIRARLMLGNFLAALTTFNPAPNIWRFPTDVIESAMELLPSRT